MKSIIVEQMTEGYLITEGIEKFAVSKERMITKVKAIFGITDPTSPKPEQKAKKIEQKPQIIEPKPIKAPPAKIPEATKPETQDIKPDSKSGGATSNFVLNDCGASPSNSNLTFKIGKTSYFINEGIVHIIRQGYGTYGANIKLDDIEYLFEHPEERNSIIKRYSNGNRKFILQAFLHEVGSFDKIGCDAHRIKPMEPESSQEKENGNCDDVAFESCANNTPENCKYCNAQSRYQDKRKLEAKKPSAPLMKANKGI